MLTPAGGVIGQMGSVIGTLPRVLTDATFNAVIIDSREAQPGDLFVALQGERTDGHSYVEDALRRGARAAIVRRDWAAQAAEGLRPAVTALTADDASLPPGTPVLVPVDEPLQTLQLLAAHHRTRFDPHVIGITGSVGKTSTKELVAAVLSQRLVTLSNIKSFNNEIGVPLTLLRLRAEHQAAVLEMGTYGPGEIASLCELARPQFGIVTNVGVSHLERMGSRDVVARAKGELVAALPATGAAILNGDDPRVRAMRELTAARTVLFGLDPESDVSASQIESRGLDGIAFTVHAHGEQRRLAIPLLGRHNVYTALAAIAIARELDVPWPEIEAGLRDTSAQTRLVVRPGAHGATILDDTYNASPASCQAALDLLAEMPTDRRIAVFGDMAELGPEEVSGHRTVGRAAAPVVDLLVVVGTKARHIGEAALEEAGAPEVLFAAGNAEAGALLRERIGTGDYILVKGARVAATEEIVAALASHGTR